MSAALCVACERPTADGYACTGCTGRAAQQLDAIAELTPAARDVAHGQTRRGPSAAGDSGPRLPLNLGATQRLDAVQNYLSGWVRSIASERGLALPDVGRRDQVVVAARWLAGQVEWLRHRQEVSEFLLDVEACARVVRGIARGPVDYRYLGPCGAELPAQSGPCPVGCACHHGPHYACTEPGGCGSAGCGRGGTCAGDVYARDGARHGSCRTCGSEVETAERQAWLDGEVRGTAFRASQIAEAYRVNVNTIRSWAARGQLVPHGHDEHGRPQFNVGEVLDLAAADAARRATEQAKRARRAAAKARTEGDDAA